MRPGPDALRYLAAGAGTPVSRPFHLRWLLPWLCGESVTAWWRTWIVSWPLLAGGMVCWRLAAGDDWRVALAAGALLLGLPGILGPTAVIPIGVDLPATALSVWAAFLFELGHPAQQGAGVVVLLGAASIRETQPVWVALWTWSPLPLVALAAPLVRSIVVKPAADPLGAQFQAIADHPIRAALVAHHGRWRDGWLLVAPWGVCLAALYQPGWPLLVLLAVTYLQLLVATDTVRLLHHAAGPVMAATAAAVVPPAWLLLAVVAHVVWWRTPERI